MDTNTLGAVHKVGTAREVAPLVAPTSLERTTVRPVELKKVEALKDLITELGIADSRVRIEPHADRFFF